MWNPCDASANAEKLQASLYIAVWCVCIYIYMIIYAVDVCVIHKQCVYIYILERGGQKVGGGISLNNFLCPSCFNIELSLPPRCLSISCAHFVSYVDFPHWPLHHFLRFCCCNIRTSPASATSCMHLVSISKFHQPCAIVGNKSHKQDNVSQFVGQLCELEGPRCLNRWTLRWSTLRVGIGL